MFFLQKETKIAFLRIILNFTTLLFCQKKVKFCNFISVLKNNFVAGEDTSNGNKKIRVSVIL